MISIFKIGKDDFEKWDLYVKRHPQASVYHLIFFKTTIKQTYHHQSHYYAAINSNGQIVGVLPLFFVNSILFGKSLVSIPFCDYGGILADDQHIWELLLQKSLELSKNLKCSSLELRQTTEQDFVKMFKQDFGYISVKTSKVRMKLSLPETSEALFSSFSAKLRSQIRKPQKENCSCSIGGLELLDDFYNVFLHNMRDLGSPVHTKTLMQRMLQKDPEKTRLFVVYHNKIPVACSLVCGFNDILINPWASFKRTHQKIAPNMLLYWEMLCYAIKNNYRSFDFGRSTPNEGTYNFKKQWGAEPEHLFWYTYNKNKIDDSEDADSSKKEKFIRIWQKLPLNVTKILGPILRRHIHL